MVDDSIDMVDDSIDVVDDKIGMEDNGVDMEDDSIDMVDVSNDTGFLDTLDRGPATHPVIIRLAAARLLAVSREPAPPPALRTAAAA
jgi:hypothetical protein